MCHIAFDAELQRIGDGGLGGALTFGVERRLDDEAAAGVGQQGVNFVGHPIDEILRPVAAIARGDGGGMCPRVCGFGFGEIAV